MLLLRPTASVRRGAPPRRLYGEHHVEVPVIEWNGRQLARVSVQGYNTEADVKVLVGA